MTTTGWGSLPELEMLVDELTEQADWQESALCAQTDPEAFFPEKGGSTREGKRICLGCEVKEQCLQYALDRREPYGIWGGLSERERRRLLARPRPNNPMGRQLTPEEQAEILAMLADATVNAVAEKFDLSWERVATMKAQADAA